MRMLSRFYIDLMDISKHFGWYNQSWKFSEEAGEALTELARISIRPSRSGFMKLVEELADLFIVGYQLILILDSKHSSPKSFKSYEELFWQTVDEKIKRTKQRIDSNYYSESPDD